jgi:O-antigen/teichoic acid export membrane protein
MHADNPDSKGITGHSLIAKNTIFLFGSKILGFAGFFYFMIVAANYLGKEDFGRLSTAISYAAIFLVLSDLGLSVLIVREIGRNRNNLGKYYSNGSLLKIILAVITIVVALLVLPVCGYDLDTTRIIPFILLAALALSYVQFLAGLFRGIQHMEYEAVMFVIEKVIILVVGLAWLSSGGGLIGVAVVFVIARVFSTLYGLLSLRIRTHSLRLHLDPPFARKLIAHAYPFAPFAFLATAYVQIDIFVLTLIRQDEVGLFRAAIQLVTVWSMIGESYSGALLPVLSRAFLECPGNLKGICQRGLRYMTLAGLPISLGIFALAREIVTVYKEEFHQTWVALTISTWTILLCLLAGIPATLLTAINRQSQRSYVVAVACALSIALNVLLINLYGYVGCAITVVITNVFLLIAYWYLAHRAGFTILPDSRTLRIYLAGALMLGAVYLSSSLGLFAKAAVGAGVYGLAVVLLGVVSRHEIRQVMRLFFTRS